MSSSKIMDATRAPSVSGAGTLSWLSEQGLPSRSWRQAIERAGLGLLLSAAYGLALGTRAGGLELLRHGLALPVTLGLMALITVPALYVALALRDAPVLPLSVFDWGARGVFSCGLVLLGLAPAAALFVVTSTTPEAAQLAVTLGFAVATGLGLRQAGLAGLPFVGEGEQRLRNEAIRLAFGAVAVIVAWRLWAGTLEALALAPIGGAS